MILSYKAANKKNIALIFLFLCVNYYGQVVSKKDSLYVVNTLKEVSKNMTNKSTKAIELAEEVVTFSEKNDYELGLIRAYNYLGLIYSNKSEFKKALYYFELAKNNVKDGKYQKELGKVLYNTAILYELKGQYGKAIETAIQSLKIKINLSDSFGIASCYNLMGSNLMFNKNYEKSISNFEKALMIQQKTENSNIEETYNNAAVVYIKIQKYNKALSYLYTALFIANSNENDYLLSNAYLNIGDCYFHLNKTDSSLYYYNKSFNQAKLNDNKLDELAALNNIGRQYLNNKKIEEAERVLTQALQMAKELNALSILNEVEGNLADLYFTKGDFKQAFLFKEQFRISADSLLNADKMKIIDELSIKYETKEIETQNKNLQNKIELQRIKSHQKNYFIYGSITLLVLFIIIFLLYVRQNKFKTQNESLDIEQKLLQIQMNPHFIFNSLQAIQSFILTNKPEQSSSYLTSFSRLMRLILENSKQEFINLDKEITTLTYYLELQKLRFKNIFDYVIVVNETIDKEFSLVPPMLLQPFIENAIEHGFKNIDYKGVLQFNINKELNYLILEVIDNGLGIQKTIESKTTKNHHSYALEIINKRIELLNLKLKQPIKLTIIDLSQINNLAHGTKIIIQIPFINL